MKQAMSIRMLAALLVLLAMLPLSACAATEPAAVAEPTATPALIEIPATSAAPTPVLTPTPVVTPATPAPTPTPQPAAQGVLFPLSATQQYAANLSLSNFSEQWFCEYPSFDRFDAADTSIAQLFSFAHLWSKINRQSAIEYINGYETMTRENFYEIITPRIDYPEGLQPVEGEDYSAALGIGNFDWNHCWYENGRFYYPAGDGEAYNRFTVVDEAYRINDWTYRFRFTIYELDLDAYWDAQGVPSNYYHMSPAQAAQSAAAGTITAMRTGTAICSPIYWQSSGLEMYRLERYDLDLLD